MEHLLFQDYEKIAQMYRPVLVFHSDEKYFPVHIADYIRNCQLVKNNNNVLLDTIIDPIQIIDPSIDPELNVDANTNNKREFKQHIFLKLKNSHQLNHGAEWFFKKASLNNLYTCPTNPVFMTYIYVGSHTSLDTLWYIDIVYVVPFCFNGTLRSHSYDSECITLRVSVSETKITPLKVALSNHEGYTWINYNDFELHLDKDDDRKRPIIYVSKESHAMKHRTGTWWRFFGLGNDITDYGQKCTFMKCVFPGNSFETLKDKYEYLKFVGKRSPDLNEQFAPLERGKCLPLDYSPPVHSLEYIQKYTGPNWVMLIIIISIIILSCYRNKPRRGILIAAILATICFNS